MQPSTEQIAAGVAKAKEMLEAHAPSFVRNMITDEQITEGVTEILTAALATDVKEDPK